MDHQPDSLASDALDATELSAAIKNEAARLGFDLVGIAPAISPPGFPSLKKWLDRGYAGEMHYIPDRQEAYRDPSAVMPDAKSVIMLAMNYRTTEPEPLAPGQGRVSRYAWGNEDYHDVIRRRVKMLGTFFERHAPGHRWRAVIDTAPLLERDFARLSGLGWFGKNTMLINVRKGSWLFLAALLMDVELPVDQPFETSHCGTCTRCLDVCPTDAFPEPYVLDARRCISYLTIELRDRPIPPDLREGVGEWLFGCDLCQEVCPWNRKAPRAGEPAFQPAPQTAQIDLHELLSLPADEFKQRFRRTPMDRTGWKNVLRNAAIVLGNGRSLSSIPILSRGLEHEEPLVRGACAWGLARVMEGRHSSHGDQLFTESGCFEVASLLQKRLSIEQNAEVIEEIQFALSRLSTSAGRSSRPSSSRSSPMEKGQA